MQLGPLTEKLVRGRCRSARTSVSHQKGRRAHLQSKKMLLALTKVNGKLSKSRGLEKVPLWCWLTFSPIILQSRYINWHTHSHVAIANAVPTHYVGRQNSRSSCLLTHVFCLSRLPSWGPWSDAHLSVHPPPPSYRLEDDRYTAVDSWSGTVGTPGGDVDSIWVKRNKYVISAKWRCYVSVSLTSLRYFNIEEIQWKIHMAKIASIGLLLAKTFHLAYIPLSHSNYQRPCTYRPTTVL